MFTKHMKITLKHNHSLQFRISTPYEKIVTMGKECVIYSAILLNCIVEI